MTVNDLKDMINEYSENEFGEEYLFHEHPLTMLPIAFSTIGDDEIMVELFFDIINGIEYYHADGELIKTIRHDTIEDMYEVNAGCTFDDMYSACVDAYYEHIEK